MTKLSELGYEIRRERICDAHQWRTYAPCDTHNGEHDTYNYRVFSDGTPCYRASGAYVCYSSYSSAYSYCMAGDNS